MTTDQQLAAIMQRVTRVETRLMKLAEHFGVDLSDGKVRNRVVATEPMNVVEVAGLDVSYGDTLAFCRRSGISGVVTIVCGPVMLGSLKVEPVPPGGQL